MDIGFYVSVLALIASLYFLRVGLSRLSTAKASVNWPSVSGEIIELAIWGKRLIEGDMRDADHLRVEYRYSVDGRQHVCGELANYTLVYPETYEFAQSYPRGSAVQVHYNPESPDQAVLIKGPRENKPYSDLFIASLAGLVSLSVAASFGFGWL